MPRQNGSSKAADTELLVESDVHTMDQILQSMWRTDGP